MRTHPRRAPADPLVRFTAAVALALLAFGVPAGAQVSVDAKLGLMQPVQPPRDRREVAPPTGTASISGRVTSAEGGAPIRRVQVRVAGGDIRRGRSVMTDADGKYTIDKLPAGRYSVYFNRSGFVGASYGSRRWNQPGKPIDLANGQKLEKIDIALSRGGVVAGRVFDEFGEPVVDARVQVMQYRWANGRRRMANMGRWGQTNDRGEFRVWSLAPGEYYVAAVSSERMFFAGPMAPPDPAESSGYAPTYFPGTASVDEAQRVAVGPGQEVNGIDFTMVTTRTASVSGTVLSSDGRPMTRASVMLTLRAAMEAGGPMSPFGSGTDEKGNFTVMGVPPGEYMIQARSDRGMGEDRGDPEMATAAVTVAGEDVRNLMLVATRGVRVSGRVVFETSPPSGSMTSLNIFFQPAADEPMMMMMMGGPGNTPVTEQNTFEARGILGRRRIVLSGLASGWALKSVRIGGTDVTDTGFEFGKENVSNVELLVTNRTTTVTGVVRNEKNEVLTDYAVVAFSTDEAHWQFPSRRVNVAQPDQNGTYRLRNLPPGSYFLIALDSMPEELGNPDLFRQWQTDATRLTIDEGEQRTLDLPLRASPSA
ncbi:MAG TPA: carboxypeptidase-like regulatory domain-containing protein [Vicinamibacterales bacterium]|nr:carboxypeptidase-like regulatory domain-containing protein [Vicinamibacterales bacterium]